MGDVQAIAAVQYQHQREIAIRLTARATKSIFDSRDKRSLGIDAWTLGAAERIDEYDHGPLQAVFELIAASYREVERFRGALPFAGTPQATQYEFEAWRAFVDAEAGAVCSDPEFALAVVQVVIYAHEAKGLHAERFACERLSNRYRIALS